MVFIANHYFTQQQEESEFTEQTKLKDLNSLKSKLDEAIKHFGIDGAFIKLSSRSPKDSTIILEEAQRRFNELVKKEDDDNSRWILLAEQVRLSSKVITSDRAIQILLDSKRVAEDIKFACMTTKFEPISVVIRKFDPLITPDTEFRGFVWNNQLTCVGQYFHTVVFPHLFNYKEQIEKDLKTFFQTKLNGKIGIPCYMLDLVWFPNGKVMLVEINPFDGEELGAFPASTGLFNWDSDRDLMTGKVPFEVRLQSSKPITKYSSSSKDWTEIVKQ